MNKESILDIIFIIISSAAMCTGILSFVILEAANRIAQFNMERVALLMREHYREIYNEKISGAEDTLQELKRAVLLARHWARVASAGWAQAKYYDGVVGD